MWWTLLLLLVNVLTLVPVSCQFLNITENVENLKSSPCTDRNHIILTPGVLTAGGNNRACVSRFYTDGPATLLLSLLTEDRQTVTASRELPPGDGGCLDFNVPLLPNTKADFVANIRYPEAQCSWERRTSLRISSGRVVTVATERAKYKRGEWVRARIIALKPDLTPVHGNIDEVWVEGPEGAWEGTRVAQWQRVRTRMGIAQLQYQLDELAPVGQWTFRAKLVDGSQGSATFWVGDYTLPPFQLSVRHAPKVLRSNERISWTVCVRYPWSEAVEGMLVIRLRGAGVSQGVRTAVQLKAPKPCHRHAVAARRLGLDGPNPPDVIVADFSFQEEGTRIWQNTTVVSQVVEKRITLEFLTKHRAVISPGLPYKIKVKATRFDDKPATNEIVRVCRFPSHPNVVAEVQDTCAEGTTDVNGVAALMFLPGDDAAPYYRFEARVSNASTSGALWVRAWRGGGGGGGGGGAGAGAALGPLRADTDARTLVPLYLNTRNITTAITVHFVVITRGGIIYRWGATTQCPITNAADQVRTAPKNSRCNSYYSTNHIMAQHGNIANYDDIPQKYRNPYDYNSINVYNKFNRYDSRNSGRSDPRPNSGRNNPYKAISGKYEAFIAKNSPTITNLDKDDPYKMKNESTLNATSDLLLDRQQLRVMLPVRVSHQMCPDSHLIAYFYHEGQLVSASKHFEMDECFGIKAEATWSTRQAQPGSLVSLQVSTPGPALCALSVLDTASKWVQPPPAARDVVMSGLRRLIDSHRNLTEYDAAGECFFNTDIPSTPTTGIEMTSTWLAAAGVRLLGGDPFVKRQCEPRAPASLMTEEAITPRSDFSEAWLWRLLPISTNGTAAAGARAPDSITRFEASAICVSRNGVAISQPAVLQVFREFFIHADSPKRLYRGDFAIIRYRIFNYLYEPLSVQIQTVTDGSLESLSEQVESVCVRARASVARRVELRARSRSSSASVRLRARAVSDGACGNTTSGRRGVSDEVVIRIAVDPEGVPVHEQKSILLCGNNGSIESSTSEVYWKWPPVEAVPGTETLTVWAVGDVTGPLLADADSLLLIPRGCGEQNMAQLATNLLALSQLDPISIAAVTAREHVARGYTRQLQYVHSSGGFSAFGQSDATSSTWLTAFAVRYLRRAHKVLWPNLQVPPAIIRAERWLLSQQMENGCFRNEGQVFHRELRGGLNEEGEIANVALTAYVITSLIESTSYLPHKVIRNSLSCLRALPPSKAKTPTKVYAHALLAFAYMKVEEYEKELWKTNEAGYLKMGGLEEDEGRRHVLELIQVARKSGDYIWWEASSLSTSIEATAYAMLALKASNIQDWASEGAAAGRWLAAHRSPSGGFVSTQDTLVALEALTAWTSHSPNTRLNVTARSDGLDTTVTLQPGVKIPDVMKMRPGERLSVVVEGTGCALIQATRAYNTLTPVTSQEKQLSLQIAVHTDGPFDCDGNQTSCSCAAVIEICVLWSGEFPEMALLEVTLPGGFGADAQLLYSQLNKPGSLLRRIELTPTNSRATLYLATRDGSATSSGHQCYNMHAVGPKTRTKPAYAKVQDYYKPSVNDTQIFTIPEDCPPRIAHKTNDYLPSDNLFAKARSLDNDEIVITHEFSFEDIPDGIPLDDPLYENLTKERKNDDNVHENLTKNDDNYNNVDKSVHIRTNDTTLHNNRDLNKDIDETKESNGNIEHNNNKNKTIPETINHTASPTNIYNQQDITEKEKITNPNTVSLPDNDFNNIKSLTQINTENFNSKDRIENDSTKDSFTEQIISKPTHTKQPTTTNQDWFNYNKVGIVPTRNNYNQNTKLDNPSHSDFHVINSDKDLEVPTGIEGPVPSIVLPPPDFIPPGNQAYVTNQDFVPQNQGRGLQNVYTSYGPYYYLRAKENVFNGRYFMPMQQDMLEPRNHPRVHHIWGN